MTPPHPYLPGMSILTPIPPRTPLPFRLFYSLPLVGWIARDLSFGDDENIYYFVVIALTAIILSVATWGLPALVMIAVCFVPVYFLFLIAVASPWTDLPAEERHDAKGS